MMLTWLAIVPSAAYAQASLTGTVRDASGAVLPGVTVDAASPALIEKVRSVITDGTGQYRIVDLRPGAYTLTFTLPGFATVQRDGIQLTGTFTATVNAELRVAGLEETITVTGETPIVDVQSTVQQTVFSVEDMAVLPTSRVQSFMVAILPGITATGAYDVGGSVGDGSSRGSMMSRGNEDVRPLISGVSMTSPSGSSGGGGTAMNLAAYQEMAVDTGSIDAEQKEGGVRINLIPRDGGNSFRGQLFTNFANNSMAGSNFTQELKDAGLGTPNSVHRLWEFNPSFGGPIKRDALWFHWTMRHAGSFMNVPMFFNKNAGNHNVWTYEPDLSRPAVNRNTIRNFSNLRLTWQASPRNKLAFGYDPTEICDCPRNLSATVSPEANSGNYVVVRPLRFVTGDWTVPISNRTLFSTNFIHSRYDFLRPRVNPFLPPGTVNMIRVQEQSTGLNYRATASANSAWGPMYYSRTTLSYITGAHAFKVGFSYGAGYLANYRFSPDAPLLFRFNNGVPNRITQYAQEVSPRTNLDADHGLFVQDRWTVNRVTLTAGLRYDYMHITYPETRVGPTVFAPARNIVIPKTEGVQWHDITPRIGVAYDVFSDGKTALKVSLNKYLGATSLGSSQAELTGDLSPAQLLVLNTTRAWTDTNRNFVPDCDLLNPAANGECRAMANPNLGGIAPAKTVDLDLLRGWAKRPYNNQFSLGIQRQLLPRVSAEVSYWRSWWGNFNVTDNRAVGPSDFDPFSITAPVDPRLPGGGGYLMSGLYDVKPEKFGVAADEYFTFAKNYGKQSRVFNGVDVNIDARPWPGMFLKGGLSSENETTDDCEVVAKVDNPSPLYCRVEGAFRTSVKFMTSYTVPRIDLQVSGVVQSVPGAEIAADYNAPNSVVAPSLGRSLAGGESNVTVNLVEPRSMFGDRRNQIDLRIGKILRFGRARATPSLDLYNVLNSNVVLKQSSAFASWLRPQEILLARFLKVGLQLEF
jgi:hypothetical protein